MSSVAFTSVPAYGEVPLDTQTWGVGSIPVYMYTHTHIYIYTYIYVHMKNNFNIAFSMMKSWQTRTSFLIIGPTAVSIGHR